MLRYSLKITGEKVKKMTVENRVGDQWKFHLCTKRESEEIDGKEYFMDFFKEKVRELTKIEKLTVQTGIAPYSDTATARLTYDKGVIIGKTSRKGIDDQGDIVFDILVKPTGE